MALRLFALPFLFLLYFLMFFFYPRTEWTLA